MSYILRNLTRGDLFLKKLHIKHNSSITVEEVDESLKDEERKGIINISDSSNTVEILVAETPVIEKVVEEIKIPIVEVEPVEEAVEEEDEVLYEKEVLKQSEENKSFNKNDNKNKFKNR